MVALLYAAVFIVCIMIIGWATTAFFQHNRSNLAVAVQLSAFLLGAFGSIVSSIGLLLHFLSAVTRRSANRSSRSFELSDDAEQFANQSLPQSHFAQALTERRNLNYEEIQRQNMYHGQQLGDRLKVDRADRQGKFRQWRPENLSNHPNGPRRQ